MELDSRPRPRFIFEKFARVGEQKQGGAGLGLAICKEIIARLGGKSPIYQGIVSRVPRAGSR